MSGEVDYLARTGVPQLMDKLICELLDSKPKDPVAFMHAALRRMESPTTNILIFGPNGSGKGTQGNLIKQHFPSMEHIESGAIFRTHISKGTALGKRAKAFIDRGELVPDDITIPMILENLKTSGGRGWLLDGFPRSLVQAQKLWEALEGADIPVAFVVEILLPRETAKERIMGRRLCANNPNHPNHTAIEALKPAGDQCRVCGGALSTRADDQDEAAIAKRHDIYYDSTTGTLAAAYYFKELAGKGITRYIALDGAGDIDTVKSELLKAMGL
eukprot:EG_transcript_14322